MTKLDILMEKTETATATAMKPSICNDNPKTVFNDSPVFVPEIEDKYFKVPMTSNKHALNTAKWHKQVDCQLKRQKVTARFHHDWFNLLIPMWYFPNGFTVIQLINMWLVRNQQENVLPLGWMLPDFFMHFNKGGHSYLKMKQVMRLVACLAPARSVIHNCGNTYYQSYN
jgi:hypothetical protein